MSGANFIGALPELRQTFVELCDWSEAITLLTTRVESSTWAWETLARNKSKLQRVYVTERGGDAGATTMLHDLSALRWISEAPPHMNAHVHLFQRGDDARALVGGPRLTGVPDGAIESATLLEGPLGEPWCASIRATFHELRLRSRVPGGDELRQLAAGGEAVEHAEPEHSSRPELLPDAHLGTLGILTNAEEVAAARERFLSGFRERARAYARPFGMGDGIADPYLHWHPQYGVWASFAMSHNRFRKAFGTSPPDSANLYPTAEINVPIAGIDRRCTGAFARDPSSGRTYLVHRGRLGRGPIATRAFWRATRIGGVNLNEGDETDLARVAVVTDLDSPRFVEHVAAFVNELARVATVLDSGSLVEDDDDAYGATAAAETFADLGTDEQLAYLRNALRGRGPVEKDAAVRACAHVLREEGLLEYQRLRNGGPTYTAIAALLESGVRLGLFDRPKRNHYRAIWSDAAFMPDDLWDEIVDSAMPEAPAERDDLVRRAFNWARETVGLQAQRLRSQGTVDTAIRNAIRRAVRRGVLIADGRSTVRRG